MQNEQNQAYTQNQQNHHDPNLISCLLSVATVETVAAAPSFQHFLRFILLTIITMTSVKIFNDLSLVQCSQFTSAHKNCTDKESGKLQQQKRHTSIPCWSFKAGLVNWPHQTGFRNLTEN